MNLTTRVLACLGLAALGGACLGQGIAVTIDNQPLRFNGMGPRSINGHVLVPLRGIFEALGAAVTWNSATQTVGAVKDTTEMRLKIGDRIASVNGRDVLLDVPPQIISGSTMVPLRFVGETLGAEVKWDGPTQTVQILTANRSGQSGNGITDTSGTMPNAPLISGFRINSGPWVRANQDVEIVLEGSPGANASFEIPGVTRAAMPMRETSPGHYVGTYRPTSNEAINGASVLGHLEVNGRERMIQSGTTLSIDTSAPRIRNIIPDKSRVANPQPTIAVLLDDQGGSGIDTSTVVLRVDGQDRAPDAQISDTFVSYTPRSDLASGEHQVELLARDKAGNEVRGAWSFTIANVGDVVKSLTHNATANLEPGDTITVTLQGEPGGRATYSIGKAISDRPMRETSPGVYVGEYVVRKGDVFTNEPVTATLVTSLGSSFNIEASQKIGFNAGALSPPRFVSHSGGERVSNPLVITGKAERGARVHVRIDYAATALGVLKLNGTVYDRVVDADSGGNWSTGEIDISGVAGTRGAEYTVTASTVNAEGRESEQVTIRLRR